MFNVGDEVRVRSNGAVGVVAYAEDGYLSVDMNNGTEMDFENESLLQLTVDYEEELGMKSGVVIKAAAQAGMPVINLPMAKADPSDFLGGPYIPRKGDRAVAKTVIQMITNLYPLLIGGMKEQIDGFNSLDAFDQVKAISESTGTPMTVFMGAGEMGADELMRQILGKTVINNISSGGDLVKNMLLSRCRDVIDSFENDGGTDGA